MKVTIKIKPTKDINKKYEIKSIEARQRLDNFISEGKGRIIRTMRGGLISGTSISKELLEETLEFDNEAECQSFKSELQRFCDDYGVNNYLDISFI